MGNIYEIRSKRNPVTRRMRWWVTTVAENNEPLCHSEMLTSEDAARTNAQAQMDGATGGTIRNVS